VSSRAARPGLAVSVATRPVSYLSPAGETDAVAPCGVPACGTEAKAGPAGAITAARCRFPGTHNDCSGEVQMNRASDKASDEIGGSARGYQEA